MAIVRKTVFSSPDIPGFFNSVEIVRHYAADTYVEKSPQGKKPTVLPGPSGNLTRSDFRRHTGRRTLHHPQPTISNDETQTRSSTDTCLNRPGKKSTEREWCDYISKKYEITAVFDRPKQIKKFSGPDYYAALTSTKNFREVFKELINNYNENKNFSPSEKIELQKLYELGYILPLTNQKAKKINQELSRLSKSLKNRIRFLPVLTKILRLAYHLCGGKEKNPTIYTSVEFLKSFDFKLPATFLINRAKTNAPEKTKSEKYHNGINKVNSRLVPLLYLKRQVGNRAVLLTSRYTPEDDIPTNHSVGDEKRSRRTQQRPGRRQRIFDQKCTRFNRDRLQELSSSDEKPITQNTSSNTQEASTFNADDLKTQLEQLNLKKAKQSPTQPIETPQLFRIFTQTVKSLNKWDSMTAAKFLALFFSNDYRNYYENRQKLRHMRKHNIFPTPYQQNFLQTAYELGSLITPNNPKKELKGGIDS